MSIKSMFTRLWSPADLVEHTHEIADQLDVPADESENAETVLFEAPPGDRAWLALTMLGMVAETQGGMFTPVDAFLVAAQWVVDEDEIMPLAAALIEAAQA
jgi:hypothetical protein